MKTRNPAHKTVIRAATVEDIPVIIELSRAGILSWATNEVQPAIQKWMDSVCTVKYFEEMILSAEHTLLVAEFAGKVSGTAYGYPLEGRFHTGGLYLSVNGQGVATMLMGELIRQAKKLGLNELSSEIYEHNHGALRFVRRQGWVQRGSEKFNGINFYQKVLILHSKR